MRYGLGAVGVAISVLVVVSTTRSAVGASGGTAAASAATPVESLAQARDALQLEPSEIDALDDYLRLVIHSVHSGGRDWDAIRLERDAPRTH